MLWFFILWLYSICPVLMIETNGGKKNDEEVIFEDDYCDVECGNKTHTMCPIKDRKAHCDGFELHRFSDAKYAVQLKILIHGHNGIRNRIAERMNVSNMLEMKWDSKLALMAENYLHYCYDRIPDPCTLTPDIIKEEDTINEFFKFEVSEKHIAQNTFYEQSYFYPYKFLERVIRSWYFEKDGMREPNRVEGLKRLMGENNFTHLGYPFAYRFGCGMARFKGGFHILCNYFPYYRTMTNSLLTHEGTPVSDCPARFPLRDEMFTFLCTDESENYFDKAKTDVAATIFRYNDLLSIFVLDFFVFKLI